MFIQWSDIFLRATRTSCIVSKLAFLKKFPRKHRAIPADPQTVRVDTTGSADPYTAFHVSVKREFSSRCKSKTVNHCKHRPHHWFRPADCNTVVSSNADIPHKVSNKPALAKRSIVGSNHDICAFIQLIDKKKFFLCPGAKEHGHHTVRTGKRQERRCSDAPGNGEHFFA